MRSGSHYRVSCCSVQTSCSNDRGFLRIATGLYDPEATEAALTQLQDVGGVTTVCLGAVTVERPRTAWGRLRVLKLPIALPETCRSH
jgi:hypothetical protein